MRRYWMPIRPVAQLFESPVLSVRVLGEDLTLFRAKNGELGLIGDRCPHRLAKLANGIPDECGLRCCYHGWMFSPTGECIDMPLEAGDAPTSRVTIKAYPVQELGGLVWAYLGPHPAPLLPRWDLLVMPNAVRQIGVVTLGCNWLQCQENTADPTHGVYLHGHYFKHILERQGTLAERARERPMHTSHHRAELGTGIESVYAKPTRHGIEKGVTYSKALGANADRTVRHSTVIFPVSTQTGGPGQVRQELQIRVPIDDTHTYHINYGCYVAPQHIEVPTQETIPWYEIPLFDDDGRPVLDFIFAQDAHVWLSQGEIVDRSLEHLGRTDVPIILLRKQLEEQLRVVEAGGDPMNTFRDPDTTPDLIHGGAWDDAPPSATGPGSPMASFRSAYHEGYAIDDADRHGPALPQIIEIMRRIADGT